MSDTPRIPLLEKEVAVEIAEKMELPVQMAELSIFRVLLRNPKVAKQLNDLLITLIFQGQLDARLRELVIMRLGWCTGSVYEWTQHWRVARQLDIPEEDLLAVRDWQGSDRLGDADRAVLAATDEVLADGAISAATWALCEKYVGGPEELIELVVAIGNWRMISSVLRSLQIPLEDGVEPWPPDGVSPTGGP